MTFDRSAFVTYTEQQTDRTITVGTKAESKVAGTGDIDIKVSVDGKPFNVRFMNVLHVPGIGYQLLSVSQISNKGFNVKFNDGRCHISFDTRVVAYGTLRKSLYYLDLYSTSSDIACIASMQLWHERLAHVDPNGIARMVNHGVVKGVNILAHCRVRKFALAAFTVRVTGLPFQRPVPLDQLLFSTSCTPMFLVRSTSRL